MHKASPLPFQEADRIAMKRANARRRLLREELAPHRKEIVVGLEALFEIELFRSHRRRSIAKLEREREQRFPSTWLTALDYIARGSTCRSVGGRKTTDKERTS